MAQPVVHFEIGGTDHVKTRDFYQNLFDWKTQVHEGMNYHLVEAAGEKSIGGGLGTAPEGVQPYVTIYILVDDIETYLKKAEALGGRTVLPETPIPGVGSSAWLADPDGITVGLFKPEQ